MKALTLGMMGFKRDTDPGQRPPASALNAALDSEDDAALLEYWRRGGDPNAETEFFGNGLAMACRLGWDLASARLLSYGANPRVTDRDGTSALTHAVMNSSFATVRLLIWLGAREEDDTHDRRPLVWLAALAQGRRYESHGTRATGRRTVQPHHQSRTLPADATDGGGTPWEHSNDATGTATWRSRQCAVGGRRDRTTLCCQSRPLRRLWLPH